MASQLHPASASREPTPPDAAGFFFSAAPAAVVCAGATLLLHGERALLDSWSPLTMGLTHFATLGFVSMVGMGAFYRTAARTLDRPAPARGPALFAFVTFSIGVVSLCIGLAGAGVQPVFVAIGALFPALTAFFWPARNVLKGTRNQGTPARAWRVAIGAFLTVTVLGVWVAHGHGGMDFPGPRSLWIQLHLSIALFGWVGAMATACLATRIREAGLEGHVPSLPRTWARLATAGVALPVGVLAADYAGALPLSSEAARLVGLAAAAPVGAATGLWSTRWAFDVLGPLALDLRDREEARLWRVAFGFAPVTLAAVVAALLRDDATSRVAFGWVAIWGWAGLVAHAVLRAHAPPRFGVNTTLAMHGLTLALGLIATATRDSTLALAAGSALIATGLALRPARSKG